RQITDRLTAVVTVADDGGSSGRLRRDFGVLPPGDLRRALAALCDDDVWGRTWAEVLQHRFAGESELAGHAVGNLLILALWERLGARVGEATGDGGASAAVEGLDWVGRLLGARGRVLPMSSVPLEIVAEVAGLDPDEPGAVRIVRGQAELASASGPVRSVASAPPRPPACAGAVRRHGAATTA